MPSTQNITVFIPSGAGAPGFAGILECLKEDSSIRVIAGDINSEAYGAALCDKFIKMPASHTPDFIDKTIGLVNYPTSRSGHILPKLL